MMISIKNIEDLTTFVESPGTGMETLQLLLTHYTSAQKHHLAAGRTDRVEKYTAYIAIVQAKITHRQVELADVDAVDAADELIEHASSLLS